ncbi:hypothetical protein M422DRAFT_262918 [Sphaerobolus stellatus SS14]|uniref:HIT-type domain-containing protein n=1 Tax=Sphaerobolus stellatus (strain SS14) TaxID=990650 RepID=A0A0C9VCD0_SPHS4|nr:hypothetical protein M422DRAFT_262918 [Sphaerobolus stellatus SS14]
MNRVRLNVKTRDPIVDRLEKPPCGICKRQISNYTCPNCNVPYCSITCFKSEAHAECSESFYRKEIEDEIRTAPNTSSEERKKMMEMLRRFEEESQENEGILEEEDEEGEGENDDLARKLEGVNLDEADSNALWALLSPSRREAFLKAMKDPESELAQQLLASEELHRNLHKPWWESPSLDEETLEQTSEYGKPPKTMAIPENLILVAVKAPIIYNITALFVAYAYVTRRLSISPLSSLGPKDSDHTDALELLSRTVPFLIDRKSTLIYRSVDDLVTATWANFEAISDTATNESFSLLLSDAWTLIRPNPVAVISESDASSSASDKAILAISDILHLFESAPKLKHVVHKLNFYSAHVVGQDTQILKAVAEEARITALKMKNEVMKEKEAEL